MSLNVLVIPASWPNPEQPLHGVFIAEFIRFMADENPDLSLSVIYAGGTECGVSFSEPKKFLKILYQNWRHTKTVVQKNIHLYIAPLLNIYRLGPAHFLQKRIDKTIEIVQKEVLKNGPVHLIHAHFSHSAGFIAAALSKALDVPYIITEHVGPFPFSCDPSLMVGESLSDAYLDVLQNAKVIIAVSQSLKDTIASYGLKNVVYIPNPIHEDSFCPQGRVHEKDFHFVALSSLIASKGIDVLLKAFAEFLDRFPLDRAFLHLKIGGDGPEKEQFHELAAQLNILENVTFLGAIPRDQVNVLYHTADCFVHASRHESFGLVCAEAQATGLPVIATKCGGPESIVTNPQLGILVENENPRAFADAMASVYQHYTSFDPQYIRQYFLNHFSHRKVCRDVFGVYQRTAQQSEEH